MNERRKQARKEESEEGRESTGGRKEGRKGERDSCSVNIKVFDS